MLIRTTRLAATILAASVAALGALTALERLLTWTILTTAGGG